MCVCVCVCVCALPAMCSHDNMLSDVMNQCVERNWACNGLPAAQPFSVQVLKVEGTLPSILPSIFQISDSQLVGGERERERERERESNICDFWQCNGEISMRSE